MWGWGVDGVVTMLILKIYGKSPEKKIETVKCCDSVMIYTWGH